MTHVRQAGRSLAWPLVIGVVVIVALAVGAFFIFGNSKSNATPTRPTNVKVTVSGSQLTPTMTVTWDAPKDANGTVKYVANYATARLSTSAGARPFQSPCLQLTKSTPQTTVILPAPFDLGVFYVDIVAQINGKTSAPSAPVLVYGPFSKKIGKTFTPTHTAEGAIPATLWCHTQGLSGQ
jgi:uncharacterized protein (UPF0333 family)